MREATRFARTSGRMRSLGTKLRATSSTFRPRTRLATSTPQGVSPAYNTLFQSPARFQTHHSERTECKLITTAEERGSHRQHPFSLCEVTRTTSVRRSGNANKAFSRALQKVLSAGKISQKKSDCNTSLHQTILLHFQAACCSLNSPSDDGYTAEATSKSVDLPPKSLLLPCAAGCNLVSQPPAREPASAQRVRSHS